ncbi:MAG: ABC transporter permease, partial [Planctomycetota bacterium]
MSEQNWRVLPEPTGEASLLTSEPLAWYDRCAAWLADRCSPILVKECRQALKSRQFLWTFLLLLLAVVAWSFWGLSLTIGQPSEESGPLMLTGYLMILAVPLFLVVPFSTFRSLVSELETETMPLLTITTMTPYQIV